MTRPEHKQIRFDFKQFSVSNTLSAMRVGTDSVLVGAIAEAQNPASILDIGCGTGVIALMMMQRFAAAHVTAIDIDGPSVKEARLNIGSSPWSDRGEIIMCDAATWVTDTRYDLIVSNPPYFVEDTRSPDGRRAAARHGSTLTALTIPAIARRLLADDGTLTFIAPFSLNDSITFEATMQGLRPVRMTDIVTVEGKSPSRRLWQMSCTGNVVTPRHDTLIIRNRDNTYTDSYRQLTEPFYLHLR